jgi:Domain of unknown function (DUF6531)
MYHAVLDYSTVGQNPLSFTRYYNSMAVPDTYAVALGSNWRHSFDRYLHIINPSAIAGAIAERETGQYVSFSSSSGVYTADSDLDYTLTRGGSGPAWTWTLTAPDDTVETYSQSGAEATLQSITRRNGYTQTPHYSSAGLLTSVTDTYGRSLGLSYASTGLLTGLTTRRPYFHLRLCRVFKHRLPAFDRHLQHQPGDASDLQLRQHKLSARAHRHHRRERQRLHGVDL